jgi:ADP-ribose pyrophosphatase YjhB (NUDIX family)
MAARNANLEVQLIANVVVHSGDGRVALTRYDASDERWWLPGAELDPYEHPDAVAERAARDAGLSLEASPRLSHIESFRGRRGWHVMFNYAATAADPGETMPAETQWFGRDALPPTFHGPWEGEVVRKALGG